MCGATSYPSGCVLKTVNRADEEDFRAFVASRSSALLSFAHVLTGNPRDAEDLVQTALAATALAWRRLRRKDNPEGYVRRTIVRSHLNVVRRKPWRERPTAEPPERVDPEPVTSAAGVALANHNGTATWLALDPVCGG
jgi:DNA-directed RNA polymerase specialized sigma24 family protein